MFLVESYELKVAGASIQPTTSKLNGNQNKKAYFTEQKAVMVEESKKGYTGDALALRGEEGRDKLR